MAINEWDNLEYAKPDTNDLQYSDGETDETDEMAQTAFEFLKEFRHITYVLGRTIQYLEPLQTGMAPLQNDYKRRVLEWAAKNADVKLASRVEGVSLRFVNKSTQIRTGGSTTYFIPEEFMPKFIEFRDRLLDLILAKDSDKSGTESAKTDEI